MIAEDFIFEEGQTFELTKDGETEIAKAEYDGERHLIVNFRKADLMVYLLKKDGTTVSNAVRCLNEFCIKFVSQQKLYNKYCKYQPNTICHIVTENIQLSQLAEYLIQQLTIELDRCKQSTEKYNKLKNLFENND